MGRSGKRSAKASLIQRLSSIGGRLKALWHRARRALPQLARTALVLSIAALVLFGARPELSPLPAGWPLGPNSREAAGSKDLSVRAGAAGAARLSVEQVAMAWPSSRRMTLQRVEREAGADAAAAVAGVQREGGAGAASTSANAPSKAAAGPTGGTAAPARAAEEPIRARPVFHAPIAGTVEEAFGWFRHEQFRDWRFRDGLSIRLNPGASPAVRAAAEGRVAAVAPSEEIASDSRAAGDLPSLSGLVVHIEHAGGWETRYAGFSEVYVRVGDRVTAGSTLGRLGAGDVDGTAHLGFSMYHLEEAIDPAPLVSP